LCIRYSCPISAGIVPLVDVYASAEHAPPTEGNAVMPSRDDAYRTAFSPRRLRHSEGSERADRRQTWRHNDAEARRRAAAYERIISADEQSHDRSRSDDGYGLEL
jgi:hypothetical protein